MMTRIRYLMPRILTSRLCTFQIHPFQGQSLLNKIGSEQAKELGVDMLGGCLCKYLEEREEALC